MKFLVDLKERMRHSISILSVIVLNLAASSCDTLFIRDIEQDNDIKHAIENSDNLEQNIEPIIEPNLEDNSSNLFDEWEPYMAKTPISQKHKPFKLSQSEINKIKAYFYEDVIENESTIKSLIDNSYIFEGFVSYDDHSIFHYSFKKQDNIYLGTELFLAGDYKLRRKLIGSYKDTVYRMLEISGVENPEQFLQQLIDSPIITDYTGCTVQLKPVKYGVIDLTSCEEDDATVLSLYNPKP